MFWRRKSTKQCEYMETVKDAVCKLKQGEQHYLPIVYQALALKDKKIVAYAAGEIAQYMQGLSSDQIIRLDERFREYSSMEWHVSWKTIDLNLWKQYIDNREVYLWIVRLGCFHPNGYFREKCIWELAEDNDSIKFVLLRLNDWAAEVREAAEAVCMRIIRLNAEELVACLPYLEKIKQGCRRDRTKLCELEECVAVRIQKQLQDVDLQNLKKYDIKARKYLYYLLLERKILTKEQINQVLGREKNTQCQFLLMTLLLREYDCSVEELDTYLQHKSKIVQRKALEKKYSIVGTYWEGLENMLMSSSIGVRGQVTYILRKHTEIDIVAYYIKGLETPQKKICILGIGENGKAEDVKLVQKYLEESEAGVVKSTLHVISLLQGFKAEHIFWKYLQDERPVVMRAAYREIVANNIVFGAKQVYELFIQTDSEALKEKLAFQLLREHSWDRLPYILQLYWYKDEHIQKVLQRGVYGRSVYGCISKESAEYIRSILYNEKYNIPKHLQKDIEFDLKFIVKG